MRSRVLLFLSSALTLIACGTTERTVVTRPVVGLAQAAITADGAPFA